MTKRILALVLAMVMALSMGVVAVAEETDATTEATPTTPQEDLATAQAELAEAEAELAAAEAELAELVAAAAAAGIVAISAPILPAGGPDVFAPVTYSEGRRPEDAGSLRDEAGVPFIINPEAYAEVPGVAAVFGGTFQVEVGRTIAIRLPQTFGSVESPNPVNLTILGGEEFISTEYSLIRDGQTWETPVWFINREVDGVGYIDFFISGVAPGVVEFVTPTPGLNALSIYRISVGGAVAVEPEPEPEPTPVVVAQPAPAAPAAETTPAPEADETEEEAEEEAEEEDGEVAVVNEVESEGETEEETEE